MGIGHPQACGRAAAWRLGSIGRQRPRLHGDGYGYGYGHGYGYGYGYGMGVGIGQGMGIGMGKSMGKGIDKGMVWYGMVWHGDGHLGTHLEGGMCSLLTSRSGTQHALLAQGGATGG